MIGLYLDCFKPVVGLALNQDESLFNKSPLVSAPFTITVFTLIKRGAKW